MPKTLDDILTSRLSKADIIAFIAKPAQFELAITVALSDKSPQAWRAAWGLAHCTQLNDKRIQPHIKTMLKAITTKEDGHQRELIKILAKITLSEDFEGDFFNVCMTIWEARHKGSSVRVTAFKTIVATAKRHPELIQEIEFLTDDHFTETLSPGIRRSVLRMKSELG